MATNINFENYSEVKHVTHYDDDVQVVVLNGSLHWVKPYTLSLSPGAGIGSLTATYVASSSEYASYGDYSRGSDGTPINNGDTLYYGDYIYVKTFADAGYNHNTVSTGSNGLTYISSNYDSDGGGLFKVTGFSTAKNDISISAWAQANTYTVTVNCYRYLTTGVDSYASTATLYSSNSYDLAYDQTMTITPPSITGYSTSTSSYEFSFGQAQNETVNIYYYPKSVTVQVGTHSNAALKLYKTSDTSGSGYDSFSAYYGSTYYYKMTPNSHYYYGDYYYNGSPYVSSGTVSTSNITVSLSASAIQYTVNRDSISNGAMGIKRASGDNYTNGNISASSNTTYANLSNGIYYKITPNAHYELKINGTRVAINSSPYENSVTRANLLFNDANKTVSLDTGLPCTAISFTVSGTSSNGVVTFSTSASGTYAATASRNYGSTVYYKVNPNSHYYYSSTGYYHGNAYQSNLSLNSSNFTYNDANSTATKTFSDCSEGTYTITFTSTNGVMYWGTSSSNLSTTALSYKYSAVPTIYFKLYPNTHYYYGDYYYHDSPYSSNVGKTSLSYTDSNWTAKYNLDCSAITYTVSTSCNNGTIYINNSSSVGTSTSFQYTWGTSATAYIKITPNNYYYYSSASYNCNNSYTTNYAVNTTNFTFNDQYKTAANGPYNCSPYNYTVSMSDGSTILEKDCKAIIGVGSSSGSYSGSVTVTYGSTVYYKITPEVGCYYSSSTYTNSNPYTGSVTLNASNFSISATYNSSSTTAGTATKSYTTTPFTYTVTLTTGNGVGSLSSIVLTGGVVKNRTNTAVANGGTIYYGEAIKATATRSTGYWLANYTSTKTCSGSNLSFSSTDFTPSNSWTLSHSGGSNGTVTWATSPLTYGNSASWTLTPNNYRYASSYSGSATLNETNFTCANNGTATYKTAIPDCSLISYTLSGTSSHGTVTWSPTAQTYNSNSTYTITPNTGYNAPSTASASIAVNTGNGFSFNPTSKGSGTGTASKTLTACSAKPITVSYDSSLCSVNTDKSDTSGYYDSPISVRFTKGSATGYTYSDTITITVYGSNNGSNWTSLGSFNGSSNTTSQYTYGGGNTYYAYLKFYGAGSRTLNKYTLNVTGTGLNTISISSSIDGSVANGGAVTYTSNVTVTVTVSTGYWLATKSASFTMPAQNKTQSFSPSNTWTLSASTSGCSVTFKNSGGTTISTATYGATIYYDKSPGLGYYGSSSNASLVLNATNFSLDDSTGIASKSFSSSLINYTLTPTSVTGGSVAWYSNSNHTTQITTGTINQTVYWVSTANTGYHGATSGSITVSNKDGTVDPESGGNGTGIFDSGIGNAGITPNTYTIKFNLNSKGTGTTPSDISATYDSSFTMRSFSGITPEAYHHLTYWNTQANGNGTNYSAGTNYSNLTTTNGATINLYLQNAWDTYTITVGPTCTGVSAISVSYTNTSGTASTASASSSVTARGGTAYSITATPATGYALTTSTFSGDHITSNISKVCSDFGSYVRYFTLTAKVTNPSYLSAWSVSRATSPLKGAATGTLLSNPANNATATVYYNDTLTKSATAASVSYGAWSPSSASNVTSSIKTRYASVPTIVFTNPNSFAVTITLDNGASFNINANSTYEYSNSSNYMWGDTYRYTATYSRSRPKYTYSVSTASLSATTVTGNVTATFTGGVSTSTDYGTNTYQSSDTLNIGSIGTCHIECQAGDGVGYVRLIASNGTQTSGGNVTTTLINVPYGTTVDVYGTAYEALPKADRNFAVHTLDGMAADYYGGSSIIYNPATTINSTRYYKCETITADEEDKSILCDAPYCIAVLRVTNRGINNSASGIVNNLSITSSNFDTRYEYDDLRIGNYYPDNDLYFAIPYSQIGNSFQDTAEDPLDHYFTFGTNGLFKMTYVGSASKYISVNSQSVTFYVYKISRSAMYDGIQDWNTDHGDFYGVWIFNWLTSGTYANAPVLLVGDAALYWESDWEE